MAQLSQNPTRMELKKLQGRYATARRGHKLLKDKRDELMKRFLEVVREDKELRADVERSLMRVYGSFSVAAAVMTPAAMQEALLLPRKEGELTVTEANRMSVTVPVFHMETKGAESINYGFAFTSGELDSAVRELGDLLSPMLRMAELEKEASLLAEEIERTRRRVNALEHIMMPRYLEAIRTIRMKLDENERGNITRLMKVKDMMLQSKAAKKDEDEA